MVLENFIVDAPIIWDRVGKKIFENPHVKQGRKMRVQITNAGMVEDLSGYTLALGWKHTVSGVDGMDVFEDSSEANVGIFEMAYTENLMTNLGNLKASLVLTSVEDMVVAESNDFYVKVDYSPFGADAEQGVGSYTRLAEILLNEESRIAAEVARVSAEETRVTDFNALVDSEIIAQNVATKLQAKEAEYLPRLVSNEQQLADVASDFNNVIANVTVDSEVITARGGKVNLDTRLTDDKAEISGQLADIAQKGKNLFDKNDISAGYYLSSDTGAIFALEGYFVSDFIEVKPSEAHYFTGTSIYRKLAMYDVNKAFVSQVTNVNTFTTPVNAKYIRYSSANAELETAQIEKGTAFTGYERFGRKLTVDIMTQSGIYPKKIHSLNDAWMAWLNGEKFPVAIAGDSTVDGTRTSGVVETSTYGVVDNQNPNAFPKLLETHLKTATGNNALRIYNAGHAGRNLVQALQNINAEFGDASVYADVKMVGIGYGINDRMLYQTQKAYREAFKSGVINYINWLYKNGIQPFLITTQAIAEAGVRTADIANYPLRTSEAINNVANEVKRELAKEYGLEIIDAHEFTSKFMKYSKWSIYEIMSDFLHFGNVGHKYESGLFFAHMNPRTEWIKGSHQLDYSSQKVVTTVPNDKLSIPYPLTDSFKILANYVKADSVDTKIMDFWIFNDSNKQLTIKAHKSDLTSATYVKIDGVNKSLTALETSIGLYDVGLYHLEVFSGASTKVDFKGFTFE